MINGFSTYLKSSIGKKQILGFTGLALSLFIIGHLSGNFLIFKGPITFNGYAAYLQSLGAALWIIRAKMLGIFCVHMLLMGIVVRQNLKARPIRYSLFRPSCYRSFATKTMPFTGGLILGYLILHLIDFSFAEHQGDIATVGGQDLGLYGVVVNSFGNPWHSAIYILAMVMVGLHITHGIQSIAQTFGINHPGYTPWIKLISRVLGVIIAVGFSTIPVYVMMMK